MEQLILDLFKWKSDTDVWLESQCGESCPLKVYFRFNSTFILTFIYFICVVLGWNILARLEYRTHFLTKIMCGNKYLGCYALTLLILCASTFRQACFSWTIETQPTQPWLFDSDLVRALAGLLFVAGVIFVASAYYRLGITGTYLGDYFGILMDAPVTTFPFNVLSDPMYDGAAMIFLAEALWAQSVAGCYLAWHVYTVYKIATIFYEGPFTSFIYEEAEKKKKKAD